MMLCKVWKRREKKIICLMQHPWFYSLPFFVYAFGKNTTKNVHLLNGLFCLYDFTCFPGCCVIVLLIFLKNCYFFGNAVVPFPVAPVTHSCLRALCHRCVGFLGWCSSLPISSELWWPLCHQTAGNRERAQQVVLKEWVFLLGFTTAF